MAFLCVVYFPGYDNLSQMRPVETVLARGEFKTIEDVVKACLRSRHDHLRAAYAAGQFLIGPEFVYDPSKSPYEYPRGQLVGWLGTAATGSLESLLRRELVVYFPQEFSTADQRLAS